MSHRAPSRSPPLSSPHQLHTPSRSISLSQRTPYLALVSSSKCVLESQAWGRCCSGPPTRTQLSAGGRPKRSPRRSPLTRPPRQGPSTPSGANRESRMGRTPSTGTPARLPRTREARAAPAAATRPGEGDVSFQHRVHRGRRGALALGSATAPLPPPRDRDPPGSPGPRPLQPSACSDSGGAAGIQTAAAAISPGASSYGNEAGPPKRAR